MRLIWNRLFAVCLVGGALLTLPHLSYAFPPGTLAEALPRSTDIVRQRVPLLIIDAEGAFLSRKNKEVRQRLDALYDSDTAKPPLSEILGGYDRQIVSCSSVQVVAPLTRVVLNSNPGPLDDWLHFGRDQATKMLIASLTEGQWATITGPQGLGINDLASKEQKAWFRSILPTPFVLRSVTLHEEKGYPVPDKGEAKTIAPEQVHIHLVRKMSWSYKTGQGGRTTYGDPAYGGHKAGDTYWDQEEAFENQVVYPESLRDVVRLQEPNKLKKAISGSIRPRCMEYNSPLRVWKQWEIWCNVSPRKPGWNSMPTDASAG